MMKPILTVYVAAMVAFCIPLPAQGADPQDSAHDTPPRAAVVTDEAAGMIRFVIDGQTVGAFTAEGLVVVKDIAHGGTLTNIGTEHTRKQIEDKGEKARQ